MAPCQNDKQRQRETTHLASKVRYTVSMLVLGSRYDHTPVMGLQTGSRLAQTSRALIDPRDLKITAYEVEGPLLSERPAFLRVADIREVSPIGMIIDSNDELVGLDDVISLKKLHDLDFHLVGMSVVDEDGRKLGKVEDYTLETQGFVIQQLSVKRGIIRGITDTGLLIGRGQIIEINDREIIVKAPGKREKAKPVTEQSRREYVNPFRNPSPQPDSTSLSVDY